MSSVKFMDNHFVSITDTKSFEELLQRSADGPIVIFKHSNACSVSAEAYEEMSAVKFPVNIIVVQDARAVSDEIEARTEIEHRSPQVIILRDGKPVWNASHWKIKADAVQEAVRQSE
jgi:bacillithiol system protein YtxJ